MQLELAYTKGEKLEVWLRNTRPKDRARADMDFENVDAVGARVPKVQGATA